MFATRAPFSDRFALVAAERSHLDPVDVYTALVAGISGRAIEVSATIAYAERADVRELTASGVMRDVSDALKYTIRSLETADDEWIAETIDDVLEAMDAETEDDDDAAGDEEGEEASDEDEGGEEEEIGAEEIASLKAKIAEAVAAWDEWEPEDQILASLKANFAASFSKAVEEMERIDETEPV